MLKKKNRLQFGTILSSVKQESVQKSQCKPCSLADHVEERREVEKGVGRDIEERLAWRNKTPFSPPLPLHHWTLPCDKLSQQVLYSAGQPGGNDCEAERCLMKVETLVIIIVFIILIIAVTPVRSLQGSELLQSALNVVKVSTLNM